MTITTQTTHAHHILIGKKRTLAYLAWVLAMILLVAITLYVMPLISDYLNSGIAGIEGRWNREGTQIEAIITNPTLSQTIQNGNTLLLRDGQAFPPQSTYPRSRQVIIYGAYQSSTTLLVQTGDALPRTETLILGQVADPLIAELITRGIAPNTARNVRMVYEVGWVILFGLMALFIISQRPDEAMVILSSVTLVCIGIRYSALELIRWLPPYQDSLQLLTILMTYFIFVVWMLLPSGRLAPRQFTLAVLIAGGFLYANRFTNFVPSFNRENFIFWDALFIMAMTGIHLYRYKRIYTVVQKQQMKWLFLGIIVALTGYYCLIVVPNWLQLEINLFLVESLRLTALSVPFAALFAMLRYRLYDADYFLNRGVVYGATSFVLAIVFVIVALFVRTVITYFNLTNQWADILLILVAIGLGTVFNRVRRSLQKQINRRFFRLHIDLDELAQNIQNTQKALPIGKLDGLVINQYRIESLIGRGGMGEVYKAWRGSQAIAFKIMLEKESNAIYLERFLREQRLLAQTHHPNLVHFLDSGYANGSHYIAMEYLVGTDLDVYLKAQKQLPLNQILLILRDIANALAYLHSLGLVHRDVKPANIMIQDTRAVLTDFGLMRLIHDPNPITQHGMVGTLQYTAPEQILEHTYIDHRADIYALGVVAYQMIAGELPFKGNIMQLVFAQIHEPPPNLTEHRPDIPQSLSHTLMRAMAKDPLDRFNSPLDFVASLREASK